MILDGTEPPSIGKLSVFIAGAFVVARPEAGACYGRCFGTGWEGDAVTGAVEGMLARLGGCRGENW